MPQVYVLLLTVLWLYAGNGVAADDSPELISLETFGVSLIGDGITCRNRIEDRGYGAVSGALVLNEADTFDRSLRLKGVGRLQLDLPKTLSCSALESALARTPDHLLMERRLSRQRKKSQTAQDTVLVADLTLQLPFEIAGKPAVLHGLQLWLETRDFGDQENPSRRSNTHAYTVRVHPQAAGNGLKCESQDNRFLTLGKLWWGPNGNQDRAAKEFESEKVCLEVKSHLMMLFRAEDPGNWGTHVRVERALHTRHRFILDNQGNDNCQEIELEEITVRLKEIVFRAAKSFPLRTVDLQRCMPPDSQI